MNLLKKNLLKKSIFIFPVCIATLAIVFTACQISSDNAVDNSGGTNFIDQLVAMGFEETDIVDNGSYFLVEGCIYFDKSRMGEYLPSSRQARTTYLVSDPANIRVMINSSIPSSGNDNWRTEIQQAINDWNSISTCSAKFQLVTSSPEITIMSDSGVLANNVIAAAEPPASSGAPGYRIRINLDFLDNISVSTGVKRYNMAHELGHCIGFRHTNWSALGESSAVQISGTPAADASSVMNGGTALNSWAGFSYYDKAAVSQLYPAPVDLCANYSYSVGYIDGIQTFQTGQQYYDNPYICTQYHNGFWDGFNSQIHPY